MKNLTKSITFLTNQNVEFYLQNENKIESFLHDLFNEKFNNLSENQFSDLSEIIGRVTFIKINKTFPEIYNINNDYEFTKNKESYDIISEKHKVKIELKNRKFGQNEFYIENVNFGGMLKNNKYKRYKTDIDTYTYFYNNITSNNLFNWNLNSNLNMVEYRSIYCLKNQKTNNKNGSENDQFFMLKSTDLGYNKFEFPTELKQEIEYLFLLNYKIEYYRSYISKNHKKFIEETKDVFEIYKTIKKTF